MMQLPEGLTGDEIISHLEADGWKEANGQGWAYKDCWVKGNALCSLLRVMVTDSLHDELQLDFYCNKANYDIRKWDYRWILSV
jgi:hypothetical protein